jgi:ABC-type dipeptide/oligopeptide/nickel transport system permease component
MIQYVLRRVLIAVPMLLGAMSIVFFAMRVLPGNPCMAMMGDQATTEALADCTKNLGLNRPLVVQYWDYIWRSVRFDFGNSFRQGYPVSEYIARMFAHPVLVGPGASWPPLSASRSASSRRSSAEPADRLPVADLALLGLSMPVFWFGILLLIVFSFTSISFPSSAGATWTVFSP